MIDRTPWNARLAVALALLGGLLAGCGNRAGDNVEARQTKFPGQVSAGGGTSGEVIAATKQEKSLPESSGTPGIPQGSGGNVGGAALGGTTATSTPLGGSGEKTPEQAREVPIPGPDAAASGATAASGAAAAPAGAASR